jgi:hypothetical protein
MNRILRMLVALVVLALGARDVAAQWNVERFRTSGNQVYTTFGLEPALVTSVGYGRNVEVFGRPWQIGAEAGLVAYDFDIQDFRARLQARGTLLGWRSVRLVGSAAFITRGTENQIYRALNFGSDFTGALGVYKPRWFVTGEFGFDKAIITYLTHSDWYREHYYPDAKDGWYLNAGGTFHYGLTGGMAIGRTELTARIGQQRTEDFNALTPPLYASLGVGFGF